MVRVRTLKKKVEQLHSMAEDNQFVIGLLAEAVESLYDVRDPIADTFLLSDEGFTTWIPLFRFTHAQVALPDTSRRSG
jgi:hypothetical protein